LDAEDSMSETMRDAPPDAGEEKEFRQRMQRIETLVQEVERFKEPAAREHTRQIVQSILDLHRAAIDRMMECVAATGTPGDALIDTMAADDLVSNVLLLHGLHPLDVEARVTKALEQVRPYLHSHGGNVEFLGLDDGVLRLRVPVKEQAKPRRVEINASGSGSTAIDAKSTDDAGVMVGAGTS
jgi:hypothetical protein